MFEKYSCIIDPHKFPSKQTFTYMKTTPEHQQQQRSHSYHYLPAISKGYLLGIMRGKVDVWDLRRCHKYQFMLDEYVQWMDVCVDMLLVKCTDTLYLHDLVHHNKFGVAGSNADGCWQWDNHIILYCVGEVGVNLYTLNEAQNMTPTPFWYIQMADVSWIRRTKDVLMLLNDEEIVVISKASIGAKNISKRIPNLIYGSNVYVLCKCVCLWKRTTSSIMVIHDKKEVFSIYHFSQIKAVHQLSDDQLVVLDQLNGVYIYNISSCVNRSLPTQQFLVEGSRVLVFDGDVFVQEGQSLLLVGAALMKVDSVDALPTQSIMSVNSSVEQKEQKVDHVTDIYENMNIGMMIAHGYSVTQPLITKYSLFRKQLQQSIFWKMMQVVGRLRRWKDSFIDVGNGFYWNLYLAIQKQQYREQISRIVKENNGLCIMIEQNRAKQYIMNEQERIGRYSSLKQFFWPNPNTLSHTLAHILIHPSNTEHHLWKQIYGPNEEKICQFSQICPIRIANQALTDAYECLVKEKNLVRFIETVAKIRSSANGQEKRLVDQEVYWRCYMGYEVLSEDDSIELIEREDVEALLGMMVEVADSARLDLILLNRAKVLRRAHAFDRNSEPLIGKECIIPTLYKHRYRLSSQQWLQLQWQLLSIKYQV